MPRKLKQPKWHKVYRREAAIAQNWRCAYCRCKLTDDTISADHITPVSKGGATRRSNIQACCIICNNIKASMSHKGFLRRLKSNSPDTNINVVIIRAIRHIHLRAERAVTRIQRYAK